MTTAVITPEIIHPEQTRAGLVKLLNELGMPYWAGKASNANADILQVCAGVAYRRLTNALIEQGKGDKVPRVKVIFHQLGFDPANI